LIDFWEREQMCLVWGLALAISRGLLRMQVSKKVGG
jgi:hypothetical protein